MRLIYRGHTYTIYYIPDCYHIHTESGNTLHYKSLAQFAEDLKLVKDWPNFAAVCYLIGYNLSHTDRD